MKDYKTIFFPFMIGKLHMHLMGFEFTTSPSINFLFLFFEEVSFEPQLIGKIYKAVILVRSK